MKRLCLSLLVILLCFASAAQTPEEILANDICHTLTDDDLSLEGYKLNTKLEQSFKKVFEKHTELINGAIDKTREADKISAQAAKSKVKTQVQLKLMEDCDNYLRHKVFNGGPIPAISAPVAEVGEEVSEKLAALEGEKVFTHALVNEIIREATEHHKVKLMAEFGTMDSEAYRAQLMAYLHQKSRPYMQWRAQVWEGGFFTRLADFFDEKGH